jgi:hypothetical protein
MAVSNSDPDAQTVTLALPNAPVLDRDALARKHDVKSFDFDGVADEKIVLAKDVVWEECLAGPAPEAQILSCESKTLVTHEDDSIADRRYGRRGTPFTFRAPATVANRRLSLASWSVKNSDTGAIEVMPKGTTLAWTPVKPGRYVVSCAPIGYYTVKHQGMGAGHHHVVIFPATALHTIVHVF